METLRPPALSPRQIKFPISSAPRCLGIPRHGQDVPARGTARNFAAGADDVAMACLTVALGQRGLDRLRRAVAEASHWIDVAQQHLPRTHPPPRFRHGDHEIQVHDSRSPAGR